MNFLRQNSSANGKWKLIQINKMRAKELLLLVVANPNLQAMRQKVNEAVLLHRMN